MKEGDRVKLITYNGKIVSKRKVYPSEDYWKLIGQTGIIQKDPKENKLYASFSKKPRVLIKFDVSVSRYNLIAHNNIENSLWILVSDLETL